MKKGVILVMIAFITLFGGPIIGGFLAETNRVTEPVGLLIAFGIGFIGAFLLFFCRVDLYLYLENSERGNK